MTSLATTTRELLRVITKPSANMWMTLSPAMCQRNGATQGIRSPGWQLNYSACVVRSNGFTTMQGNQEKNTTGQHTSPQDEHHQINKQGTNWLHKRHPPSWPRLIFSQRNDHDGVAALKEDGKLHTGGQKKAEILNKQFTSVFLLTNPAVTPFYPDPATHLSTGCWSVFKESRSFWQE